MATYRGREVRAVRYKDNHQDEFLIYSADHNGERVKKADLVFTDKEKAAFIKEDEENYKTSYNVEAKPDVNVENKPFVKTEKSIKVKDSEATKAVKAKAETPNPTVVTPVNTSINTLNKPNSNNWFNRP